MAPSPLVVARMRSTCFLLLLLVLLLGLSETAQASDGAVTTTTPRLKLFTIFSIESEDQANATTTISAGSASNSSSNSVVGGFDLAAIKAAKSDFILTSHVEANGEIDGYESTDSKQILYESEHWKLIQEGSFHEDLPFMWARFHSVAVENATACLAVAKWSESWVDIIASKHAASLAAYINGSCKAEDIVALALSSPVPSGDATDTLSSSTLLEPSQLLHQQQYVSSSSSVMTTNLPSATASRLFLRLKDTMCIDKAATPSASSTSQEEELALELCTGADCQVCKPPSLVNGSQTPGNNNSTSNQHKSSSKKHTLVAVLSCTIFLAATLAVFFVLFRGRFFSPDERSKEEKEITTNLSYVLTI